MSQQPVALSLALTAAVLVGCALGTKAQNRPSAPPAGRSSGPADLLSGQMAAVSSRIDDLARRMDANDARSAALESGLTKASADVRSLLAQSSSPWRNPWILATYPLIVGGLIGGLTSYYISFVLIGQRDQKKRAIDLLKEFMADDFLVRARLVTQEYLLPSGAHFDKSLGENNRLLGFEELNRKLGDKAADAADHEARYYLRAIPSYFWLVEQAMDSGLIDKNETCFDQHYAWYWTFIIEPRIKQHKDSRIFRRMNYYKEEAGKQAAEELARWRVSHFGRWTDYPNPPPPSPQPSHTTS